MIFQNLYYECQIDDSNPVVILNKQYLQYKTFFQPRKKMIVEKFWKSFCICFLDFVSLDCVSFLSQTYIPLKIFSKFSKTSGPNLPSVSFSI